MKKRKMLGGKLRDLTPLKDVTGGRHRAHGSHAHGLARGDEVGAGLGPFGLRRPQ